MQAGIYTYPWDLDAEGYDTAMGNIAESRMTAVNLATSYHAGKFLLPHNPRRRIYFAEDGAVYFRPDRTRYTRIQPRASRLSADPDGDPLTRTARAAHGHGLDLVAWVVCLHNSFLGEQYPDCTLHNAFGDPYLHSLCPAHPDVQAYMLALLGDIVRRADIAAVELESPGYMPFIHGYHHEILGVALDETQQMLLALSFNPAEMELARTAGVDAAGVRRRVAALLTAIWESGDTQDSVQRDDVQQFLVDPEFGAYCELRERISNDLVRQMVEAIHAINPRTEVRLFAPLGVREDTGQPYQHLADIGDAALTGYAHSNDDARRRANALRADLGEKPVYGMVRAIAPDTTDPARIAPRVAAWRESGVQGINFYNYGLMTRPMLAAIQAALSSST